ncbi:MAG: branched-chain amino acid ABC transporter permease [Comamonadaceae bacterium]|nr:MAG: branched-chain amino acid ABC transporter permease [Comamonadaceae bacterium]
MKPFVVAGLAALGVATVWLGLNDKAVMNLLILVMLYAYWGIAWNLAAGTTGLMSLGHALFAGTGAYTVAYLYSAYGLSPWLSAPVGVALAALQALFIGVLCFRFRVRGHYFGLLTLACAEIAYLSVGASQPLGRSDGLSLDFSHWGWGYLQFREKWPYALMAGILLVSVLLLCRYLLARRVGYYWRALRDNEEAAEALGIPAMRYKLAAITISAMLTALGGAFYAQYISFVDPRSVLGLDLSVQILVFCIVGGMRSLWGPILGAALLLPLGEGVRLVLGTSLPGAPLVLYALILIVVAIVLPQGLSSLRLFQRRDQAAADVAPSPATGSSA